MRKILQLKTNTISMCSGIYAKIVTTCVPTIRILPSPSTSLSLCLIIIFRSMLRSFVSFFSFAVRISFIMSANIDAISLAQQKIVAQRTPTDIKFHKLCVVRLWYRMCSRYTRVCRMPMRSTQSVPLTMPEIENRRVEVNRNIFCCYSRDEMRNHKWIWDQLHVR